METGMGLTWPRISTLPCTSISVCAGRVLAVPNKASQESAGRIVAQIFNLLDRRLAVGRAQELTGDVRVVERAQIENLRYSRLQICATIKCRPERRIAGCLSFAIISS